ncbi:efflux RND transporter periplasmic adaptor subunit [Eikenella sp. Marseille-P7795]|uniref:efflux RND transporter periplasmic adaptor subunit n=1 Tax=Eikenella sp. Marseille-P7795 TaxID=2866577 RepID=UPI001CE4479C|nr:efflux RND transporter periplasmic adaptor subunit [Eikenella sp. Marseille-P7795]
MRGKRIILLGLCCMVLAGCGKSNGDDTAQAAPMKINVVQMRQGGQEQTLLLSGRVVAKEDVAVGTPLQGLQVLSVKADVGERVERGQVLAVLEHSAVQSQLAQNEAALKRARANLASQQAAWREAAATLNRYQALADGDAVSRMELDQQRAKAQTAKAAVQAAQAEIAQMQAQLSDSRYQRQKAQVIAPVGGVITSRAVEAGTLTGGNALFHIAQNGVLEVQAEAGAEDLERLSLGLEAEITADNRNIGKGSIRLIQPEIDSISRVAKIRISTEGVLDSTIGSYVQVAVRLPARLVNGSLPFSAIGFDDEGKTFVKIVDMQGKVHIRHVEIGAVYRDSVEIVSGLKAGERVVRQAGAFVEAGDVVEPVLQGEK